MQRLYYGEIIDGEIKLDNENEWDELYKKYVSNFDIDGSRIGRCF